MAGQWTVGPTGLEEPVELISCGFCQWEDVEERLHLHEAVPYGAPDDPGRQDTWLCDFCYRSLAVSAWLAGFPADKVVQDMNTGFNVLRASLEGHLMPA
jgi:hypothetical protein